MKALMSVLASVAKVELMLANALLEGAKSVMLVALAKLAVMSGYCARMPPRAVRLLLLPKTEVKVALVAFCAEAIATAKEAETKVLNCMFTAWIERL